MVGAPSPDGVSGVRRWRTRSNPAAGVTGRPLSHELFNSTLSRSRGGGTVHLCPVIIPFTQSYLFLTRPRGPRRKHAPVHFRLIEPFELRGKGGNRKTYNSPAADGRGRARARRGRGPPPRSADGSSFRWFYSFWEDGSECRRGALRETRTALANCYVPSIGINERKDAELMRSQTSTQARPIRSRSDYFVKFIVRCGSFRIALDSPTLIDIVLYGLWAVDWRRQLKIAVSSKKKNTKTEIGIAIGMKSRSGVEVKSGIDIGVDGRRTQSLIYLNL
ncbi:hypothetical protein EVAR_2366_1 [Eumeta japonica]|uniref:Uncharacterized protein n=1 Tax=Eumeta variegata TaxID=151549 RepID=A0A4C1SJ12_EUMVA|nr:hypothetical protein EVAR_2366_1 [Eumeta japonica]